MIARMSKYDFILYAGQSDDFIERLRELGLVDVTCRGWEPSEGDRQLVTAIEGRTKALAALERFRSSEHFDAAARPFASGDEAYERYGRTAQERAALRTEIGQTEKAAEEARPWGDFSAGTLQRLARRGVVLRFFTAQRDAFEKSRDAWNEQAPVEVIHETSSTVWFVAVSHEGAELSFDAQEVKAPAMTAHDAEAKVASLRSRLSATDAEMSRAAASAALIERDCNRLREELQRVKVTATAEAAADGTLLVMEGWAERETSDRVDALLDEYPNVLYIKSDPTPEDETPVKLKNNRFARIFEMVGDMYARPKYGTIDLTPFFAPFYMLFFGICLNDAGYGLILLAMGMAMLWKFKGGMMRRAAWFATMCAVSTIVFGLFCGSFFGVSLKAYFPSIPLRLPGEVFLVGAGHRPGADSVRTSIAYRHGKCYGGIPLCAFDAGLVPRHPRGQSGRRASAARSGVGHSGIHHFVTRLLRRGGHRRGADAFLQLAGQEPVREFRNRTLGYL